MPLVSFSGELYRLFIQQRYWTDTQITGISIGIEPDQRITTHTYSDPTKSIRCRLSLPLETGLQPFAVASVVVDVSEQRADDFLILLQQCRVCRRLNGLMKISQLLPETESRVTTNKHSSCCFLYCMCSPLNYEIKCFTKNTSTALSDCSSIFFSNQICTFHNTIWVNSICSFSPQRK